MRNNFPKQANFTSDLSRIIMIKNTKLIRALVFTALLVALTPAAYSAGFTTPGTSFEGVHISNRDKERNLNYSISIDSGEVVQGKRGFFRLGILPEIRVNRLKLVLQEGTSLQAMATFLSEGNMLGTGIGKMQIAVFELCSSENKNTPLLVIKDVSLGSKKPTGKLLSKSTSNSLPKEFKALIK